MPQTLLLEVSDQRQAIEQMIDLAHAALLKKEDELTVDLLRTYQATLNDLINDLTQMNARFLTGETPKLSDWMLSQERAKSLQLIAARMGTLQDQVVQQLLDDLHEFYQNAYDYTSWSIDQATPPGIEINYNMPTDAFIRAYVSAPWKGSMFSQKQWVITNDMAQQMQMTLTNSIAHGDSVKTYANKIRNLTGVPDDEKLITRPRASAQLYRATTISRTEMIRIARLSQKQVFDDNKHLVVGQVWTEAPAGIRVCPKCHARNGMTRKEIEEGKAADGLAVDPPGHPNCRCFYAPQLKTWKELLGDLGVGMGDLEHIDQWEMLHPGQTGKGLVKVKIQPYEEWAA